MAKVDTRKIKNYDIMTPEEKLAALEAFEYEDFTTEVEKYKNAASKANSEAAEWKRKHNAILAEREQKRNAEDEELNALREKLATMKRNQLISTYKSQYIAMGYDEALADATANAMVDGDTDKVFANQMKFINSHDKRFKAELLGDTPKPPAGHPTPRITLADLQAMSAEERADFARKCPDEYKNLHTKN